MIGTFLRTKRYRQNSRRECIAVDANSILLSPCEKNHAPTRHVRLVKRFRRIVLGPFPRRPLSPPITYRLYKFCRTFTVPRGREEKEILLWRKERSKREREGGRKIIIVKFTVCSMSERRLGIEGMFILVWFTYRAVRCVRYWNFIAAFPPYIASFFLLLSFLFSFLLFSFPFSFFILFLVTTSWFAESCTIRKYICLYICVDGRSRARVCVCVCRYIK